MRNQYIDTIRSLAAALEAKDPRTYGHADRVSQLSMAVGKQLGFAEAKLEQLQVAGILHDRRPHRGKRGNAGGSGRLDPLPS